MKFKANYALVLLAVYEPVDETLITGSDDPAYHVPLMDVLARLGHATLSRYWMNTKLISHHLTPPLSWTNRREIVSLLL